MKTRFLLLMMLPLTVSANTLYRCTDASGQVLYTNQKTGGKNCTALSQDQPISTFAAPKAQPKAPTPGDFPRVAPDQQKARDGDRRAILDQELAAEQKNLDEARKVLAEQEGLILPEERMQGGGIQGGKREARIQGFRDKVQLHERNIEALKKELANLK
jgi:hypothetical protein